MVSVLNNKPAIVVEVEDHELAALAAELRAEIEEAEIAGQKNVEQFQSIGKKLAKAKKRIAHGKWTEWLEKNVKVGPRQAQRWIRLSKTTHESDLTEAWKAISGHYDNEDDPDYLPISLRDEGQEDWCSRCARMGVQTKNCPQCAEMKKANRTNIKKHKPATIYAHKTFWTALNKLEAQMKAFFRQFKAGEELVDMLSDFRAKYKIVQDQVTE